MKKTLLISIISAAIANAWRTRMWLKASTITLIIQDHQLINMAKSMVLTVLTPFTYDLNV